MKDFLRFFGHLLEILHFVRGVLAILSLFIIACAVALSAAEGMSFGGALYLTAITVLTVGYGDITPKTISGRFLSVVIGAIGVVFVGIVVAVATRALHQAVDEKKRYEKTTPGDSGRRRQSARDRQR